MYADGHSLEIVPLGNGQFEVFNITESGAKVNLPLEGIYDSIELVRFYSSNTYCCIKKNQWGSRLLDGNKQREFFPLC